MKIAAFSDTHGLHWGLALPKSDVAIFCGDYSKTGNLSDLLDFITWYKEQPAEHKILVPGNHDLICEQNPFLVKDLCKQNGITLLVDDICFIKGFSIYGTPYTPQFYNWAFMDNEKGLFERFKDIPWETDILACHGPMNGYLDVANGKHVGSLSLRQHIEAIKPKLFLFGHIHTNGSCELKHRQRANTRLYNVSICDNSYTPINEITTIEL